MTSLKTAAMASLLIAGFAAAPSFAAETAGQKVDDVTVLTKIKADLLQSKNVDGLDVNVDVKDGHVTLSGTASTDAERSKAESIAKNASGVKGVENKITLKAR
ncbi:MAG TPA: BON domain-containing protein [Steroidobacteraceae bacterium]|nr:BON domain-containing protein [Steroidobacteraceae bacterium]